MVYISYVHLRIYYIYILSIYIYVCIVIEIDHRVYHLGGVLVLVGAEITHIYIYIYTYVYDRYACVHDIGTCMGICILSMEVVVGMSRGLVINGGSFCMNRQPSTKESIKNIPFLA